jgi:hemerythrin
MADIGFAPQNCHAMQHAQVLKVLAEVRRALADGGNPEVVGVLVEELGKWFVAHAQMMDAALAEIMIERGYDPETGRLLNPVAPDVPPITGCGGSSCS